MLAHVGAFRLAGTCDLFANAENLYLTCDLACERGMRAQTSTPMRWKRPDADYMPELMIQPEVCHLLRAHMGGCKEWLLHRVYE